MPIGVDGQKPAGFMDFYFMPDAGEHVERFASLRMCMVHAVGGNERKLMRAGEIDEGLVASLFEAVIVPLQFDVEIVCAEDADELLKFGGIGVSGEAHEASG